MGLGGEKKGGVKNTQQKVLFDVYLRVDYRQRGNMELGPFEVGKHWKKKREYKVPLLPPQPTLCQVVIKRCSFFKSGGVGGSHQTLPMQIAGDNSEVAALGNLPIADCKWAKRCCLIR